MKFKVEDKVQHILSKDYLLVLKVNNNEQKYVCRTKDHQAIEFFEFEVEEIKSKSNGLSK